MRALSLWLAAAALALALPPARADLPTPPSHLDHVKRQILAKLGLDERPQPMRAPPRDVVRQILKRAADHDPPVPDVDVNTREIIAIAQRDDLTSDLCGIF